VKKKSIKVEVEVEAEGAMGKIRVVKNYSAFRCMMPVIFHSYANDFLKAAKGLKVTGSTHVLCFLYCKSIELALKAFLLAKDMPPDMLKDKGKKGIGHDLEIALGEAESRGLVGIVEIPYKYREELRKANYYYVVKGYEYFDNYELAMSIADSTSLKVLSELASILVTKLEKPIGESVKILIDK
jgi:HEPN domain-containing protein